MRPVLYTLCSKKVSEYLLRINYNPKVMHEFNDGCATQYKSRHCFGVLATTVSELGYESVIRHFFETAHAKGAHDAAGDTSRERRTCP